MESSLPIFAFKHDARSLPCRGQRMPAACASLSGEGEIEGRLDLIRKAKPRAQSLAAHAKSLLGRAGVKRYANEIGKLAWHSQDGPDHGKDVRCAVWPQSQRCGGRKRSVGRIDDDAASHKWDTVLGSDLRRDVRLHIDGSCTRLTIKLCLFRGRRYHAACASDVRVYGIGEDLKDTLRPRAVGREDFIAVSDSGRDDPVACNEFGCEPTGDSETDNAGRAARDRRLERGPEFKSLFAEHRYPSPARDIGLERERGNGNDPRFLRHPSRPITPDAIRGLHDGQREQKSRQKYRGIAIHALN
jgi:hypothetical protein